MISGGSGGWSVGRFGPRLAGWTAGRRSAPGPLGGGPEPAQRAGLARQPPPGSRGPQRMGARPQRRPPAPLPRQCPERPPTQTPAGPTRPPGLRGGSPSASGTLSTRPMATCSVAGAGAPPPPPASRKASHSSSSLAEGGWGGRRGVGRGGGGRQRGDGGRVPARVRAARRAWRASSHHPPTCLVPRSRGRARGGPAAGSQRGRPCRG